MNRYAIVLASVVAVASADAQATWTLSSQPVVSIGGDGTPATEFSRIAAVARLTGGRTAVLNESTNEIRVFGPRGEPLRTFGRTGSGPGEFRGMTYVGRSADTLFVFDFSLQRITAAHFGDEPRVAKIVAYAPVSSRGRAGVFGRLSDGRWTVETFTSPGWDGPPGTYRLPASVGIVGADATGSVDWLVESPSMAVFVYSPTGNLKGAMVGPVGFTPFLMHVANGASVVYGDAATDSITIQTGRQRKVVRLPMSKRAITQAMADSARDRALAMIPESGREKARGFTTAKYDLKHLLKELPTFSKLLAGVDGETWIEAYSATNQQPTRYLVIAPDGAARAWLSVPAGFRIAEVGRDYVAGVHFDADDVETVRIYSLTRH